MRATVVTGMPRTVGDVLGIEDAGAVDVDLLASSGRFAVVVTSVRLWLAGRRPCRPAASRWLSTAPGPTASTAASQRPSRRSLACPTA